MLFYDLYIFITIITTKGNLNHYILKTFIKFNIDIYKTTTLLEFQYQIKLLFFYIADLSIVSTASPLQNSNGKTKDVVPSIEIRDDGIQSRRVASSNDNRHGSDESIPKKDVLEKDINPSTTSMKGNDPVLGSNITPKGDVSRDESKIYKLSMLISITLQENNYFKY